MFSHVMLGVNDLGQSKKFYDAILAVLGYQPGVLDDRGRCFYFAEGSVFAITLPINGEPASHGNGSTIGFNVASPDLVNKWHAVGLNNGGSVCEDPPGERDGDSNKLYLAYLRDPSGNKICALHRL